MNKIILVVLLSIITFCFYLLESKPRQIVVWDAVSNQKVVDLPEKSYKCQTLVAVIGDNVTFCKLEEKRPIQNGVPMVMGDFNSSTNKIRITKETSNDAIVHELVHYAISCTRKTKDEELCVRSAQKMMLELKLIK